ncbi:MAG: glycosyltransferase family 39 protein, partial [Bryobacteraceae bacterium]
MAKVVEFLSGRFAAAGLLLCTLILGVYGMGRSLWLDEAWVANSINAPTLHGMFIYPDWLQTSPPLFLLLARWAVGVFGLSDVSLRLVPLLLALLAVAGMLAVARRVVSAPLAVLACAALAFHPTAVEYFRSVKQYSGEVAATTLVLLVTIRYLQSPKRKQFYWLLGVVAVAMPLSYPTVFLLAGVLWAIRHDARRSAVLVAVSGSMLAILYWWFIRPNVSSALQVYWSAEGRDLWMPVATGLAAAGVVAVAALPRFGIRGRLAIVCALPFIPFAIAEAAGWYPQSPRTSLFLRPCLLLVLVMAAAEVTKNWRRPAVDLAVTLLAILTVVLGMRKQFHEGRFQPEEDFAGVVRYLSKNVGPTDIVL